MKKIIIVLLLLVTLTGCSLFKMDSMENITILTSNYAIEFITDYLYGDYSLVTSIYPDGVDISNYTFTEKQIKDYSRKDMFIYMGKTNDSNQALTFYNNNKNIKIIDATFGMEYKYGEDELWLNPSNLSFIAQNIKNGLSEYITSKYLLDKIDPLYKDLKVKLSTLDAEYKTSIENAKDKTIVVNSDNLLYLTKYNLEVISLDKDNENYDKNLALFKNYIKNEKIEDEVSKVIEDNKITILNFKNLKNITDEERDKEETYLTIMYQNLDELKKELYKNS